MTGASITLRRPSRDDVRALIRAQRAEGLTYESVGMTILGEVLDGFAVDDNALVVGSGDEDFDRARDALQRWASFDLDWLTLVGLVSPPPIVVGTDVAVVARRLGISFVNVCRIVAVVDEADCFGFAYGTLTAHIECGEELFLVTRDGAGTVSMSIRAYSRPAHWMTKLGAFYARRSQAEFARDSMAAMRRAVHAAQCL